MYLFIDHRDGDGDALYRRANRLINVVFPFQGSVVVAVKRRANPKIAKKLQKNCKKMQNSGAPVLRRPLENAERFSRSTEVTLMVGDI